VFDGEELVGSSEDYWPSYAVHLLYIYCYAVHYCTSFYDLSH
jgi:hypothetical protein